MRYRLAALVLALLVMGQFSAVSEALVEQWVPYVPESRFVSLSYSEENGQSFVSTTIEFSCAGFNVSDWGTPTIVGNSITINSEVWMWTGPSAQVITFKSHNYDLGYLPKGQYTFAFTAWGNQVASMTFDVYENVTTHEGDLIIDGTKTVVIENCTYRVAGSIYVKEQSKLVTRNALLIIDQNYSSQQLRIMDSGRLLMENSAIYSEYYCPVYALKQAQLDFFNSTPGSLVCSHDSRVRIYNSKVHQLRISGRCKVEVLDSRIDWTIHLEFLLPSEAANLEGLRPLFFDYWNLHENHSDANVLYDLTIRNTFVNSWSVMVGQDSKLTISGSEVERMLCEFRDAYIVIDGAKPSFYRNWTLGNLTLLNTSIAVWLLDFDNCLVEISNTATQIALWKHNNVSLKDSTVDLLLQQYAGTNNILQFQRTRVEGITCYFSSFYIYGEADFSPAYVSEWVSTNITRNYDVLAENASGNPTEEMELTLLDKNGTRVWNGLTDSLGKANFNLTFADGNYAETLVLKTFREGFYNASETVGLLSKTPIVINLTQKPIGDINENYVVNILDVFIVARAFGAKPGDPNWDTTADLDKNGIIDILDIFAVARDYGMTV